MNLKDYKIIFTVGALAGVLLFASPTLGLVLHRPPGEKFSELWMLGPGHMAEDYPFNVTDGVNYSVFLGVGDHLGSAAYYEVDLKLRNSSDVLPNDTSDVPSPLPVLYRYEVFLTDGQTWETDLNFSFSNVSLVGGKVSSVGMVNFNDALIQVDKTAVWDSVSNGYYYQLIVELWLYDVGMRSFSFNGRFLGLWLKMTQTGSPS